jgi:GntP family permease
MARCFRRFNYPGCRLIGRRAYSARHSLSGSSIWLVKEYFGLSVVETFKSWTVMETILSVLSLVLVLLLSLAIH